jgi:enoyl-CoA hydratase/carnithine racemase
MCDSPANFFQRAAYVWRELPVPVIAAVDGVAFGGGLQIAMGADVRIASPSARFSIMEIRWGIIPDMAISQTMRHTVRLDRLTELVMTGRIFAAVEAEKIGVITAIAGDPYAAAHELAATIAGKSPHAVRAAKSLLNKCFDEQPADALQLEARLQSDLMGRPNQLEAVRANRDKREPRFQDAVE